MEWSQLPNTSSRLRIPSKVLGPDSNLKERDSKILFEAGDGLCIRGILCVNHAPVDVKNEISIYQLAPIPACLVKPAPLVI